MKKSIFNHAIRKAIDLNEGFQKLRTNICKIGHNWNAPLLIQVFSDFQSDLSYVRGIFECMNEEERDGFCAAFETQTNENFNALVRLANNYQISVNVQDVLCIAEA